MKKFIAAAAGLMLAGTMVSTAFANVEVSGDSRVRYYYQDNYDLMDGTDNYAHARVRMTVKGSTESGAYAKARLKWDVSRLSDGENAALKFDLAYLSVPMGPVTFMGGRLPTHVTAMVEDDVTRDAFVLNYAREMHSLDFIYEFAGDDGSGDDEDSFNYIARYEFSNDGLQFVIGAMYTDPAGADGDYVATMRFAHDLGTMSYSFDYAIVGEDLAGGEDDGHMGYMTIGVPTGEAGSVSFIAGFTKDGAVMDVPIGFTMIGGDTMVTPGATANVGALGDFYLGKELNDEGQMVDVYGTLLVDTWFAGISASYSVSEKVSLDMTAAYADMDVATAWEVGAKYNYAIADGVKTYVQLGYLDVDELDDPLFGAGWGIEVAF